MERKSLYVESTIPSYATARISRDIIVAAKQSLTQQFWENERNKYDLCIGQDVLNECQKGDMEAAKKRLAFLRGIYLLPKSKETIILADEYQKILGIPDRAKADCAHLAICVIEHIDYMLSWNCTHLGPIAQEKIRLYNEQHKLWTPLLVTPENLLPYREEKL
jgi:hypothetical protein